MSHTLADLSSYFPSKFISGDNMDNNSLFHKPHCLPYDFASSSSTESESDDEDFAELTRRFTRSVSLQERLKNPYHPLQKKRVYSVSPESTLNWNVSARSSPTTPFPHADEGAWDILYASRMNKNNLNDAVFINRGLLRAPRHPGPPFSHHNRNCTLHSVNEAVVREQQLRITAAAGGRFAAGRPAAFGRSAWPPVESHRRQQTAPGGPTGGCNRGIAIPKKSCAGTGVFLPRNYNNTPPEQTPAACHVPARMVVPFQSFNKNPPPNINGVFSRQHQLAAEMIMARRQQAVMLAQQRRSDVTHDVVVPEVVLPQEWTY